jgi:CRP-like cAMP-binding protein
MTAPIVALLRVQPLFARFEERELARLAPLFTANEVDGGTVLVWEGRPHDSLFLLARGRVVVTKAIRGETEAVLAHLDAPGHFGELDLIDAQCAAASVTAEGPCLLLAMGQERLRGLLAEDADLFGRLAWELMRDLTGKIRRTNERLQEVVLWGLDATRTEPGEG